MNPARVPRPRAFASRSNVGGLALLAVCALVLTGCAAGTDAGPTAMPTTGPTASSNCSNVDAGATKNPLVVTPATLCELDGSTWEVSAFTLVVNTPKWQSATPECDAARKTAFYDAWDPAARAIQTLDLLESPSRSQNMIGSVGISVIESQDAAAAVAALDAEGAACGLDVSQQLALEHGAWKGARGPTSQDEDDERWSWWIAADDRWALVQAYAANDATDAEVAKVESAVLSLLDAQEELLTR
jgi:hypothetical protein